MPERTAELCFQGQQPLFRASRILELCERRNGAPDRKAGDTRGAGIRTGSDNEHFPALAQVPGGHPQVLATSADLGPTLTCVVRFVWSKVCGRAGNRRGPSRRAGPNTRGRAVSVIHFGSGVGGVQEPLRARKTGVDPLTRSHRLVRWFCDPSWEHAHRKGKITITSAPFCGKRRQRPGGPPVLTLRPSEMAVEDLQPGPTPPGHSSPGLYLARFKYYSTERG